MPDGAGADYLVFALGFKCCNHFQIPFLLAWIDRMGMDFDLSSRLRGNDVVCLVGGATTKDRLMGRPLGIAHTRPRYEISADAFCTARTILS